MARRKREERAEINVGEVAFLAGVFLSVAAAFLPETLVTGGIVYLVLLILGLIVGLLNLRKEEYTLFLLVSLIFLVPGALGSVTDLPTVGPFLDRVLTAISTFVLPAALVVACKALWDVASSR